MKTSIRLFVITFCLLLMAFAIPGTAVAYTGGLSSDPGGGIYGTGNWIYSGPTWLEWNVKLNNNNSWHYSYDFGHPAGETSHFILEVSHNFTENDIFSEIGDFSGLDIGWHGVGSGNPTMPEDIYGIKFDNAAGLTSHFEFDSFRVPVWGDFYSKNGNAGGHGLNSVWNAGFTVNDFDPTVVAADGSYMGHLLVPDSQTVNNDVPEPSTMMLFGVGICGYLVARRRRK